MRIEAVTVRTCATCPEPITGHGNRRLCDTCRALRRSVVQRGTTRRYLVRRPEQRRRWITSRYGITPAQYDAILARGCEACGTHEGKICLDHDHATGRVRGALCDNCNKALGHLGDEVWRIAGLLTYLKGHVHED